MDSRNRLRKIRLFWRVIIIIIVRFMVLEMSEIELKNIERYWAHQRTVGQNIMTIGQEKKTRIIIICNRLLW